MKKNFFNYLLIFLTSVSVFLLFFLLSFSGLSKMNNAKEAYFLLGKETPDFTTAILERENLQSAGGGGNIIENDKSFFVLGSFYASKGEAKEVKERLSSQGEEFLLKEIFVEKLNGDYDLNLSKKLMDLSFDYDKKEISKNQLLASTQKILIDLLSVKEKVATNEDTFRKNEIFSYINKARGDISSLNFSQNISSDLKRLAFENLMDYNNLAKILREHKETP